MIICVDFDGVVVRTDRAYDDVRTPLQFVPGAKEGLRALKAAGHTLILWSARANRGLLYRPELDPAAQVGGYREERDLAVARYKQMLEFVERELPGVFDLIDDGAGGKPCADMFIDDKAIQFGGPGGLTWRDIVYRYGEFEPVAAKPYRPK